MSENRNAQYRYQVLDRCFSDWNKKYTIEDLLEIVNNHLYELEGSDSTIKLRQLRGDLNAIRKMLPDNIYLDAKPFEERNATTDILSQTIQSTRMVYRLPRLTLYAR